MAKDAAPRRYTITSIALEEMLETEETKMDILHHMFNEEGPFVREVLLLLSELCVLHSSMVKYVELIRKTPMDKEDKYIITSQDLVIMNNIKLGYEDLAKKLQGYNIYMAIN